MWAFVAPCSSISKNQMKSLKAGHHIAKIFENPRPNWYYYKISWHFKFTKLRQLLNMQLSIWNPLIYILISYITFYKLVSVMYPHIWVWAVHDCVTYFSCSGNDVTFFCSLFVVYGNMGYWVSKEGIKNQYKKGKFLYFVTEHSKKPSKIGHHFRKYFTKKKLPKKYQ